MKTIEESLLSITGESPLLRKFMSKEEIKVANQLVKEGRMVKGHSHDKPHSIVYYTPQ